MVNSIGQWILTLNLFAESEEENAAGAINIRLQRLSTRLYLVLLIGEVFIYCYQIVSYIAL